MKTGKRRRRGRSIRVESDVVGGGAKRRKGKDKNQIKILETKQKKKNEHAEDGETIFGKSVSDLQVMGESGWVLCVCDLVPNF